MQGESKEGVSLVKALYTLAQDKFSGIVKVSAKVLTTQRNISAFLVFKEGALTMVERRIPTAEELMTLLGRRLKIAIMDTVIQYAFRRNTGTSVRELLETIVSTRALSWTEIEKAMGDRMIVIIEQLLPYPCLIQLNAKAVFDISYGDDRHGISCTHVFQQIEQRQQPWRQYLEVIPSLDALPCLRPGVLASVEHQPTREHLQRWVDGKRSLADIAEALDQDPLTLAPLYVRWVNEQLLDFWNGEDTSTQSLPVILSVDDSPIVQTMIRRALSEKYEVISAIRAVDALAVLNDRKVSLILLDVTMPEIDGLEFCRTIRKINKLKDIPVIMLTAKDGLIDRAKGHMAGSNRYLTKPVDKDTLLSTVKEFI